MNSSFIRDTQTNSKKTVVFVHGNFLGKDTFYKQFESLILKEHRLIAMDFAGHGDAPPNINAYTLKAAGNSIYKLIQEKQLENVILVAHSLGGHICIHQIPEMKGVSAALIFGTPPILFPPNMGEAFLPHPVIPLLFTDELNEEQISLLASTFSNTDHDLVETLIRKSDGNFRTGILNDISSGNSKNEVEILEKSTIPICLAVGENDAIVNQDYVRKNLTHLFWDKELKVIKESSHSPHLENPEAFNNLLKSFIDTI